MGRAYRKRGGNLDSAKERHTKGTKNTRENWRVGQPSYRRLGAGRPYREGGVDLGNGEAHEVREEEKRELAGGASLLRDFGKGEAHSVHEKHSREPEGGGAYLQERRGKSRQRRGP